MSIPTKLEIEIDDEFEALANMEVGSETYKATVDGLGKLLDRAIEIEKLENEQAEKKLVRERDEELKRQQMKEEKIDKVIGYCIEGVKIGTMVVLTVWGTLICLNFEKEGTVTTGVGRGWTSKLIPRNWG